MDGRNFSCLLVGEPDKTYLRFSKDHATYHTFKETHKKKEIRTNHA